MNDDDLGKTNVFPFDKNKNKETPVNEPYVWEFTYLDGTTEYVEGLLSVGPIFIAIVSEDNIVNILIMVESLRSVKKICTVKEWDSMDFQDASQDSFEE